MAWTVKYVSVAGGGAHDGTSEANAWSMSEALAAYAAGQRIKVQKGTYTSASRTFSVAGTASSGVWWEGYDTTPGDASTDSDLTGNNSLTKPVIQCGTNTQTFSGAHHLFTGLDISGNPAGTLLSVSGTHVHFDRCRAENTDSGSGSYALRASANGFYASRSWFKANAACNYVAILEERGAFDHCVFRGANSGLLLDSGSASCGCIFSIFDDQASNYGIDITTAAGTIFFVIGNTFYGAGSHGIRHGATQTAFGLIRGNILANNGGYGVGIASGGPVRIARLANDFYSNTSGKESGFGDWPSLAEQTESSSPFTSAAGHDFSLVTGASAKASGAGGAAENESYQSYLDIGAVQRQESGGSAGMLFVPNLDGV